MSPPLELTDDDWQTRVLDAGEPVVVDFWAPWCVPCRKVHPMIEDIGERYAGRVVVAKLNIDDHPRSAARYDVLSLPTVMVFRDGEPVARLAGTIKRDRLEEAVASALA